jgi:enoyl-CoA hydratase/carnithine racemase
LEREYKFIVIERKGKSALIKFNRPEKKNAMHEDMKLEIIDALELMKQEKRMKAVIIYGGEEIFSAGFDRDEVQALVQGKGDYKRFVEINHQLHETFFNYPKLLIAAINGYALAGAFDLAVICHLRIASKEALFGHPEIRFGACPLFFPYMMILGRGKALEIALNTGTKETYISAEEAYRLNLINKLVEKGAVLDTAIEIANKINQSPEFAVRQLIHVSNIFFNQINKFDDEIDVIVKSMSSLLGV